MNPALSPAENERLAAVLRPGETPLWLGRGVLPAAPPAGFLARLFGKPTAQESGMIYAITAKRVLALPPQGEAQEWFLMLGLVQEFQENPDGSGDIIFDFDVQNGQKVPRGLIGIPSAAQVRNLLNDAIDAAYQASPWSV